MKDVRYFQITPATELPKLGYVEPFAAVVIIEETVD